MSASPNPRMTEEEYLKIERAAEFKSEFYDGIMYPMGGPYGMSGGSAAHALIIPNLAAELRQALKQKQCAVYVTELRLRLSPSESYAYPDIVAVCGPRQYMDQQKDTLVNPTLIVEVLSPSTEAHDRGLKFRRYRQIESLQEYGLVSQTEPRVEIFRRQLSGDWLLSETVGLDATCHFDSVACQIALSEIYYQVTFDPAPPVQPAP
jgi:Uma2 family endonuclease